MGFFEKIKQGLEKTRQSLSVSFDDLFYAGAPADDEFLDELEERRAG